LHGTEDNVIPPSEEDWLASEIPPHLLKAKILSPAIVHVEPGATIPISQEMDLINYIAGILGEAGNE
jgi:hypothetical protein